MKKNLLLLFAVFSLTAMAQQNSYWNLISNDAKISKNKNVLRETFPDHFLLFELNRNNFTAQIQQAPNRFTSSTGVILNFPLSDGTLEAFEVFEASNFAKALQDQYSAIRSYVGIGKTDKNSLARISVDPNGIQVMISKAGQKTVFLEPFSADGMTYAVYNSSRKKGKLPFTCSTEDQALVLNLNKEAQQIQSSSGELLIFRLALSCNGEYTQYFGGTVAGALAAMNATMTRVNGVFEKDFGIHMDIIPNNDAVIFTNAATDPYTSMGSWNGQLQTTLTNIIGEANYDVGHMFGATGGGGNAGCIGCVCVDGQKGRGITSPSDGVPAGDNFDIDYVAHELGHQFGANHTFSHNVEGTGVNVEPGSASTIMGYAGITNQDVQPHSDDYFVYASIKQVQDNMVGKPCPVRIPMGKPIPVTNAGPDYTIPKGTPFVLSGSSTNPNADALTYCWEQNDTATNQTGANSAASPTKTAGPNWRSYDPVAEPVRYFPPLNRVVANQSTTQGSEIVVEALSVVARTLNFVLTTRDNFVGAGQTSSDATKITVNGTAGPFLVNSPNSNVSWQRGTNQTVTWDVAGTTANGVDCPYVDIYLSTNGGTTFPILLASKVPNDGSELVSMPATTGNQNRIMVKGNNHIFLDVSNTDFTIATTSPTFSLTFDGQPDGQNKEVCQGQDGFYNLIYSTIGGFSATTTFSVSGNPVGTTATLSPSSLNTNGTVQLLLTDTDLVTPGVYQMVVTATSGSTIKNVNLYLNILNSTFATMTLVSPTNQAFAQTNPISLEWTADPAATQYDIEVATDIDFNTIILIENSTTNSIVLPNLADNSNYFWRVLPKNTRCQGIFSEVFRFTTGEDPCGIFTSINVPVEIPSSGGSTVNSTLTIPNGQNIIIDKATVTLNISHSYLSDITVTLISPNNTSILLFSNECGSSDNAIATFDDDGITLTCSGNPSISGTLLPENSLSNLIGENSQGTWTLGVTDAFNQDGGTINSWSLKICEDFIPTELPCGTITSTWNGTTWSNGFPVANVSAIINDDLVITRDMEACSLVVSGTAQVLLTSGNNMILKEALTIANTAAFTVENNANLIQLENVQNTGEITVNRETSPLKRLDYVMWSTPVTGSKTLKQFSPFTIDNRFYNYNTTNNVYTSIANPVTVPFGEGKGYLIRMPDNHPANPTSWNGEFKGIPKNGIINVPISYISATQKFNLIGNPYPSTISAESFLNSNQADLEGIIYFWRKTNNAAGTAYATYTLGGATTTSPTSPVPNGTIQVGQGFIVAAKNVSNPRVQFSNGLRVDNNSNQFFRSNFGLPYYTQNQMERHRIWLNLTNDAGLFSQMMVGYMSSATNEFDSFIDGKYMGDSEIALSSLLYSEEYVIQGKSLPFEATDVVPLVFRTNAMGTYTISLGATDGIFEEGQAIFLRDYLYETVHDLRSSPYVFTAEVGVFSTRFEIVYENSPLSLSDAGYANTVIVATGSSQLKIKSTAESFTKITVYDVLGRTLYESSTLQEQQYVVPVIQPSKQTLLVKIVMNNGQVVVRKVHF